MADGPRDAPARPVQRNPPPPLLATLMSDTLDPGYARAAARKAAAAEHERAPDGAHRPATGRRARISLVWLVAGALVLGLLLSVAAKNTRQNASGVDETRRSLNVDVSVAQQREVELAAQARDLAAELRSGQSSLGAAAPLQQLAELEQVNALVAVTGPGLDIVIDDPAVGEGKGAVLDKDVQVLVNGLWSAGAEAVAVGGVRLRVTSAIRQAGSAILVDNRPVLWPLTVQAIGDPEQLHVRFANTLGFARFTAFVQLYDITFDVTVSRSLQLPAAPAVDTRYLARPTS